MKPRGEDMLRAWVKWRGSGSGSGSGGGEGDTRLAIDDGRRTGMMRRGHAPTSRSLDP